MNCASPCNNCTRAKDPRQCEDKTCARWRKWYIERWDQIHGYYCKHVKGGSR